MQQGKQQLQKEFAEQFGPLYIKHKIRLLSFVKQHPKKSFLWMLFLLGINFLLMLFLDTREVKQKDPFRNMSEYLTKSSRAPMGNNIEPTISNIMVLHNIQDSLKFYSIKEHLVTHEDTILLKGLLKRYAMIDPSIFKINERK